MRISYIVELVFAATRVFYYDVLVADSHSFHSGNRKSDAGCMNASTNIGLTGTVSSCRMESIECLFSRIRCCNHFSRVMGR